MSNIATHFGERFRDACAFQSRASLGNINPKHNLALFPSPKGECMQRCATIHMILNMLVYKRGMGYIKGRVLLRVEG